MVKTSAAKRIAAAKEAANNGVKIFAVGIGSTTGELVPIPSENGGTDFVRDASGQLVKSHLDEATLKQIAGATGGLYQPLGQQGEGLKEIYNQGLASFTRHDLSSRQAKVPLEQFHWALLAALGCFIAEMLIGTRRKVREAKTAPAPVRAKPAWAHRPATNTAAALGLALLGATATTRGALPQTAEQAYQQGDFAKSQKEYTAAAAKEPTKTELQFNAGSAAYKAGDLAQAATAFQNSLHTEQVPVQQGAYYNLGNTQFRLGQKTEKSNPKETIETWEKAVSSYDAALQIEPGDLQAKHNRDLVKHKIEQLKKQEDQKKQQQQQQKTGSEERFQGSEEVRYRRDPDQQAGQNGQEPKDQKQPDQRTIQNQQAGQNGQEPKDQKQPDQKNDPRTSRPVRMGRSRRIKSSQIKRTILRTSRPARMGRSRRIKSSRIKNDPRTSRPVRMGRSRRIKSSRTRRKTVARTQPNPSRRTPLARSLPEVSRKSADGQRPEPGESVERRQRAPGTRPNDKRGSAATPRRAQERRAQAACRVDARSHRGSTRRSTATAQRLVKRMNTHHRIPTSSHRRLVRRLCHGGARLGGAEPDQCTARSAHSAAR